MDNKVLLTREECYEQLKQWGINYKLHEHEAAPTMAHMLKVNVDPQTVFIKTLFYVDKKNQCYLVLAHNDTVVGKQFWKLLGMSSGNMRLAKQEIITESIQSQIGSINPFALVNDHKNMVKKVIIDPLLETAKTVALVPIQNTATVEVTFEDLIEKVIKNAKKDYQFVPLIDEAVEQQMTQKQQQQVKQQEVEQPQQTLAITVKKGENFSKWYQQVITKAELIEYYDVSGCYILRPWAYFIWENIQKYFDELIKGEGVDNTYFPMFITQKQLTREKDHVEGFKAEVAWVTKSGDKDLHEPIAIRPTSETIMYPAFAKWIKSHRDLPLKVNQWSNVVRWEFKFPTPFLRTREFLWQEGHTAHTTMKEAEEQVFKILDFYELVFKDLLAVPVIKGVKTETEKFAGGYYTSSVETVIPQNGRGLQAGTSHHLGQNFSKMFDIVFEDEKKEKQLAAQTSWGISTRCIGAVIMFHGDDKGLVLPPKVAKYNVVIIPIISKDVADNELYARCEEIKKKLHHLKIRVHHDDRDVYHPGWKYNHWEQKGVTLRFEVGPKELQSNTVRVVQRFDNKKYSLSIDELDKVHQILDDIHVAMYQKAKEAMDNRIKRADNWEGFMTELNKNNTILTRWCQRTECEEEIKKQSGNESKEQDTDVDGQVHLTGSAKTLNMPLHQDDIKEGEKCFFCGQQAKKYVLWGRSY